MDILEAVKQLDDSDEYRVLKRLHAPDFYQPGEPIIKRIGIVIDTETTGVDTAKDKIIELGFVAFEYDADSGQIYRILHTYDGFEDPQEPIPEVIKKLTGIDDEMVKNQSLDDVEILEWLGKSSLMIAHNAAFDRAMLERRFPSVKDTAWACSFADIDWQAEGIGSRKLDYIACQLGYFFDGHRAVNDAQATLHLLTYALPVSKKLAMAELLVSAREKKVRLFAIGAGFDKKDTLKDRGYRWLPSFSSGGSKKGVWSTCVAECDSEKEQWWLSEHVYGSGRASFKMKKLDACNRYSVREFELD
ncbi:MAG: 3'-5' exonuclease [Mariprofundaceae bacterium]